MKNRSIQCQVILLVLAFALAPIARAERRPDGGPTTVRVSSAPRPRPTVAPRPVVDIDSENAADPTSGEQDRAVTIHSTGDVKRGKIGSFVIKMNPAVMFGGMYVNFKVSGTAEAGVDYVALVSPVYIGKSGYAVILVETLANKRGSGIRQLYSIVVTLENGPGYAVGELNSAKMMIKD